ncbi:heat shock protein 70 family protein [Skeletonema marinoi]|uniref:Heat shock protein 70 family protein n=1 Tax=Skeletonema marinoi TaxID=267567 RepID=A0AAD8XTM9_9STRA|nr:heat shock protein 70 family protein [Skeletonema marinoi]
MAIKSVGSQTSSVDTMLWSLLPPLLSVSDAFQPLSSTPIASSLRLPAHDSQTLKPSISRRRSTPLFANNDDEQHLQGIGVGIDLGTTNSAVAMMLPRSDSDGSNRNVPTMIEIDSQTTLPSVVALVPSDESDDKLDLASSLSLPPWTYNDEDQLNIDISWPVSPTYNIFTGNEAIEYEQYHPNSSYRNVKRVIGTGGKMASLALGVVPNLVSKQSSSSSVDSINDDITNFLMMDDETSNNKKKKGKKKKKKGNKWKRNKENELPKLHKQLEQAQSDPALLSCTLHDESLTLRPEQISACILRKLFDVAEQHYCKEHNSKKVKVTRAVIGVPAYFTEAQRRATIRASELAGVDKVKLLPEPEAAALAYGNVDDSSDSDFAEDELILVFDLGGGTFDVSILEVGGGFTEVLATVGNNRLGGTDFDRRVAEYLSGKAVEFGKKSSGIFVKDWYRRGSGEIPDIILRVAEEVRICLSNQKIVEILVPLTEEGWRKLGGGSEGEEASGDEDDSADIKSNFIGPFDTDILESTGWVDGQDYIVVTLDRKIFEAICASELQMLLQPIREVAIMAGALLPGEARPSFVENALAMEKSRSEYEDGEDFWEFDDEADEEEGLLLKMKGGREVDEEDAAEALSEQALEQIQLMDLKAQKKAQQRGRRNARDIDKKERSFRKQKQSAMEDATTASLLGKQQKKKNQSMSQQALSLTEGTKKVQEGIHGRVLSRIVLVGGATRMPVIGKLLEAVVGQTPQRTVNPDEAVALGCAVQAGILDGEDQGQTVLSPMAAAVMRALAKKRGMMVPSEDGEGMMMEMGGGISGMIVDEFDDEDDFY